jgi:arabinogalactan endo-1,4-beta-galactosidase
MKLDKAEMNAREFAREFQVLSQDVEIYSVQFDNFAKKQKDAWDTEIDDLKTKLSNLNFDLEG